MDPHLKAVLLAYGLGLAVLAALVIWVGLRGARLKARLAALEAHSKRN